MNVLIPRAGVVRVCVTLWILSWFAFLMADDLRLLGASGYGMWVGFKAALPMIACVCKYASDFQALPSSTWSKFGLHATYIPALAIVGCFSYFGVEASAVPTDAGPQGIMIDMACFISFTALAIIGSLRQAKSDGHGQQDRCSEPGLAAHPPIDELSGPGH